MSRSPLSEFSGSAPFLPPTPSNANNLSGQEKPNVITVFLRIDSLIYLHFLFGKSRDCSLSRGSPSRTSPLRTNISTTPTWEVEINLHVRRWRIYYRPIESVFSQGQSESDRSDAHQICQLVQSCEGTSQNHVEHPCSQQDPRARHQFHEMS